MSIRTRASLVPDRVYYDESREIYFVTPDCVGGYWYDTLVEVAEAVGIPDMIYPIDTIPDY